MQVPGRDQALLSETDQVLPALPEKGLLYQVIIGGIPILDQGPLHGFFMRIAGDIDRLHGLGIQPGIIHTGGYCPRSRIKVLDLLGHIAQLPDILGEGDGIPEPAARMGGHEIGDDILVLAGLFVDLVKETDKVPIDCRAGLAHPGQDIVGDMLGRHPQLAADMVLTELPQKGPVPVRQQIVEAEARPHKDLFDAGKTAQLFEQGQIIPVVHLQVGAGLREQAAPVLAGPPGQLLFAGRGAELRGRSPDVIDIALEIRLRQHLLRLPQDGGVAADLDNPALVEGQGAEIAVPVASPVGGQAEFDLPQGGHPACLLVHGMPGPHIGQGVDVVHLLHGERLRGRVLDDEGVAAIGLIQALCLKGVRVGVLQSKALRIGPPPRRRALADRLVVGQADGVIDVLFVSRLVDRSVNKGDVAHIQTGGQGIRDLHDAALPHAVGDQVRAGVQQNGPPHLVGPVIVVGHPPQAGLQPAQDHRCPFKGPANEVAVDHDRVVRPPSHDPAGRKGIPAAVFFIDGIVVDHGIHIAGGDQKAQPGLPQDRHALRVPPVRLADHADRVAAGLEDTRNNGRPEAGVVHVGIAADIDKIKLFDPLRPHVLPAHGKKPLCIHVKNTSSRLQTRPPRNSCPAARPGRHPCRSEWIPWPGPGPGARPD